MDIFCIFCRRYVFQASVALSELVGMASAKPVEWVAALITRSVDYDDGNGDDNDDDDDDDDDENDVFISEGYRRFLSLCLTLSVCQSNS